MSFAMTKREREAFLAGVHVGVMAIAEKGRGPLAVPVWYQYRPGGELRITTGKETRKAKLLAKVERFTLCVQTETPPYKYVTVEGPIVGTETTDLERDIRPLSRRYLGREAGDRYTESIRESIEKGNSMVVRMRPERWYTVDYSKG